MKTSPFLDIVKEKLRFKQMTYATEKSYLYWIRFFLAYVSTPCSKIPAHYRE